MTSPADSSVGDVPRGNPSGLVRHWQQDLRAGFLVFLIALPLCLAIASASGYPPIAGLITAIVGAIVTTFISNSELTIKGPAAGLILITLGAMTEMRELFGDARAYQAVLGIGLVAGLLQVGFALLRGGALSDYFPASAVHGMLAAIGVIIILKQVPIAVGFDNNKGEPIELIERLPQVLLGLNPVIAAIGGISLLIMFLHAPLARRFAMLKRVPPQLIVLLFAIPASLLLGLDKPHDYVFGGQTFSLTEKSLVNLDPEPLGIFSAITFPSFDALSTRAGWYWIGMFAVIGTLESLLSAKAVDMIDPWKRKTDLNRDVLAVGAANTVASCLGGLPMISEIVRSRANIDNGARTRFGNFWHGLFLLVCVASIPMVIHRIPNAALASMLIFTGFRLASPNEFLHVYKVGVEQLTIFVGTLVAVLLTDLLVGILIGIGIEFAIHLATGVSFRSLFWPSLDARAVDESEVLVVADQSAVFSNWLILRRRLEKVGLQAHRNVTLDLSGTRLVDHSVMEKLHELEGDFRGAGLELRVVGLENHRPLSAHPMATRLRRQAV